MFQSAMDAFVRDRENESGACFINANEEVLRVAPHPESTPKPTEPRLDCLAASKGEFPPVLPAKRDEQHLTRQCSRGDFPSEGWSAWRLYYPASRTSRVGGSKRGICAAKSQHRVLRRAIFRVSPRPTTTSFHDHQVDGGLRREATNEDGELGSPTKISLETSLFNPFCRRSRIRCQEQGKTSRTRSNKRTLNLPRARGYHQ